MVALHTLLHTIPQGHFHFPGTFVLFPVLRQITFVPPSEAWPLIFLLPRMIFPLTFMAGFITSLFVLAQMPPFWKCCSLPRPSLPPFDLCLTWFWFIFLMAPLVKIILLISLLMHLLSVSVTKMLSL